MISEAKREDLDYLVEMDLELFGEDSFGPSIFRKEFEVSTILVARDGDNPVGYAVVRKGSMNDLLRLGVSKEYQGKGVGRELLNKVLELPGKTLLFVRRNNEPAISLYKSAGFNVVGQHEQSWVMLRNGLSSSG